jgi:taurine--2-oxoglutarate transaminase
VPDLITMAKGLTSGYVPLAAVVVSEPIAEYFDDKMLFCGLTYSSHPLACAAGVATLEVYQEEGLIENAARLGQDLGQRLEEIKARHPSVGDVRYIGLFSAIELVKDRATKEPLSSAILSQTLRDRGLSTLLLSNLVTVSPPLCISETELRAGLQIIDEALDIADQNLA